MNKKFQIIFLSIILIFFQSINIRAEESLIFYYKDNCKHCEKEMIWLKEYSKKNKINLEIINIDESEGFQSFEKTLDQYDIKVPSVPLLIDGDKFYQGYLSESDFINKKSKLEADSCPIEDPCIEENKFLKFIKKENTPLILVAAILGLIDGFNPCAMWVLLILLTFLIQIKERKKMIFLGTVFIFVSGFMYFLIINSWINIRPLLSHINNIQRLLALLLLCMGIYSLVSNLRKTKACKVNKNTKRSFVIQKLKEIVNAQSLFYATISIVFLAITVNLIELGCSLGIPLMFSEILNKHQVSPLENYFYLLVYIFFFILDDLIIFIIAIKTFKIKAISNKFSKAIQIIASLILIVFALIMLINPSLI